MKNVTCCSIILTVVLACASNSVGQAANAPKAPQVLSRHFAALGGQPALQKIDRMLVRATKETAQGTSDCEMKFKLPGKILIEETHAGVAVREGRDGRARFWRQDAAGVRELTGAHVGGMMDLAIGFFAPGQLFWNEALAEAVCREARHGEREMVVLGQKNSFFPLLFFDRKSGLLVKANDIEIDDYRAVQNIKVPFTVVLGDKTRFRVREVVINPVLPDTAFERPDRPSLQAVAKAQPPIQFNTLLSNPGKLGVVRHPAPAKLKRGELPSLPKYDPNSGRHWQIDLRGYDLHKLDLNDRLNDLLHADFDSRTHWPAQLPAGFDRARILELGRNPGLGLRQLHQKGVTGKGVGLAIIDQTLLVDHAEYGDRLRLYEEIHIPKNDPAQMHGPAVASIAVGKTLGVAPEADLYYIAETHGTPKGPGGEFDWDFAWLGQSIHRLLDVNATLPMGQKIRVISISVGWSREQKGYTEAMAAVERAGKEGVFVVSTSLEATQRLAFHGLGREAMSDPDNFNSYGPGSWWATLFWGGQQRFQPGRRLLVPMDARCTASPTGASDYVYYSSGGWSWAVPWIAGLYALCCQVDPDITPEQFWAEALRTGRTISLRHENEDLDFGTIADPLALVASLEQGQRAKATK